MTRSLLFWLRCSCLGLSCYRTENFQHQGFSCLTTRHAEMGTSWAPGVCGLQGGEGMVPLLATGSQEKHHVRHTLRNSTWINQEEIRTSHAAFLLSKGNYNLAVNGCSDGLLLFLKCLTEKSSTSAVLLMREKTCWIKSFHLSLHTQLPRQGCRAGAQQCTQVFSPSPHHCAAENSLHLSVTDRVILGRTYPVIKPG